MSRRIAGRWIVWTLLGALYASLVIASNLSMPLGDPERLPDDKRPGVRVPLMTRDGPTEASRSVLLHTLEWNRSAEGTPVVLLHGSPGGGANFEALAPRLADAGRRCVAPDLPGFGLSDGDLPDLGARAHAHYTLALMDRLGLERAHIVGWSNGGAVALNMADIAPHRVASVTMLASVGPQATEGSGSWLFEHAKYKIGRVAFWMLQRLTPHFGLFGSRADTRWLRNFDDTDQRPLADILSRLEPPLLILHGRHDFLTADWNAERHHELAPASRLVMLDASHFIPFLQVDEATEILLGHFARHDEAGVPPLTGYDNRAPRPARSGLGRLWDGLIVSLRAVHWLVWIIVLAPLCWAAPRLMTVLLALLVAAMTLDFGVATAALWAGAALRVATDPARRRSPRAWATGVVAMPLLALTFVWLLAHGALPNPTGMLTPDDGLLGLAFHLWGLGILASIALGLLALALARLLLTPTGWRTLRLLPDRVRRLEFWPTWALYLAIAPRLIRLTLEHGGPRVFTCANPGVSHGGGIAGESKLEILRSLGRAGAPVLPAIPILPGASPDERARHTLEQLDARVGPFPVVLKPDVGQRGAGVALARDEAALKRFLDECPGPAMAQRFHPGPVEIGLLWVRDPAHVEREPEPGAPCGRVFSVTRKIRNAVVGDGRRSVAQLVGRDARLRHQRDILLASVDDPGVVPPSGERVTLGAQGNHARGARFEDGGDLITPELERVIDDCARNFRGENGGGLDYGRFDIRCESEELLRRGEGLAIIELNGVTGESTNIYDPDRPRAWALRVLGDQWETLARLGAARRRAGARPIGYLELARVLLGLCRD
jgi:pimeloyl-ACP methyl ester carboxylesterase